MCGKLFTMHMKTFTLMGMPIEITNDKYHRHAIEFNLGLFLSRRKEYNEESKCKDMDIYAKILRKVGEKLTELELESEFISTEGKKSQLESIVKQMFLQLEDGFNCFIKIDEFNCINFRFEDSDNPKLGYQTSSLNPCSEICNIYKEEVDESNWFKLSAKTINDGKGSSKKVNDHIQKEDELMPNICNLPIYNSRFFKHLQMHSQNLQLCKVSSNSKS